MGKCRSVAGSAIGSLLLASSPSPLKASETQTYTYDARGRLVSVISSGTVNNNRSITYCYDKADNRTLYNSDTSGAQASCTPAPSCTLTAISPTSSDEFAVYPRVEKSGSCPTNVTLSYSIQYVSGPGSYYDGGFVGGNVLYTYETSKPVAIYPTAFSIPAGQELRLDVTFTSTTPGVTISPSVSNVTIVSSY